MDYTDRASGEMDEAEGNGQFVTVELRPIITILEKERRGKALELHREAHQRCFIARSVNFPVTVEATIA